MTIQMQACARLTKGGQYFLEKDPSVASRKSPLLLETTTAFQC